MKIFKKISVFALVVIFMLGITNTAKAVITIGFGSADSFAVLAGSGITNTGTTTVTGDVGSYATLTQTGFGPGANNVTIIGINHNGDATTQSAKTDLLTAYNNAATIAPATTITSDLGTFMGGTLTPGVYRSGSSIGLTGTVTLDGAGDPNAVFVFQAPSSTLTTAANSHVVLTGGTQACNVFWQVGSSATLGTTSDFKGNILAFSSITDNGFSTISGRFLANNGLVTLNNTIIVKPSCTNYPVVNVAVNTGGGIGASDTAPLINIIKVPSPLALTTGSGSVNYTYTVTNIGKYSMTDVSVSDDKCNSVKLISGDINNDSKLDLTEIWTYSCTKMVYQTETNVATAYGKANGWDSTDTSSATVVVGVPGLPNTVIIPPLIHIVKIPNIFSLPIGGGDVTYVYIVTNPGTAPLSNVSVSDNKCTGLPGRVTGHPGDLNKNDLLDKGEVWVFACKTNITQTTTNIGTAQGYANGLMAIDTSPATVVVLVPGLPKTGLSPIKNNIH